MPNKSLYQQISNPIETYTDGYGHTREVYEPKYVGVLRKAYNLANRFLNGSSEEEYKAMGMEKPQEGLGILEFLALPEASVLKSIRVTSTKNLPKTYAEAESEFHRLANISKERKLSKQEESKFNLLWGTLSDVDYAASEVATERTKRAWEAFDKKLEAAEKSPKPEMIWSDFEQAYIPSHNLWYKPGRVQEDPKEMWELMYKNIEMKEKIAAASEKAKDVNNYSAGFFTEGFQYKQGGILKRK